MAEDKEEASDDQPDKPPADGVLPPSQFAPHKKRRKGLVIFLAVLLFVLALGAAGYLYWLLQDKEDELARARSDIASLESRLSDTGEDEADGAETAPSESADAGDLPVVVFSPGGLFTDAEKNEITSKMIDPLKHWSNDQDDELVSIHVQEREGSAEYFVDVIHRDGVYEGFLYGTVDAATQDWWTPTCLDACEFTDEFQAAYPEVVAESSP